MIRRLRTFLKMILETKWDECMFLLKEIKKIQTRKVKALKESKEEKKSRSRRRIKPSQLDEMLLRKCLGETMSKGLLFCMKFFR